jgi:hypothetical protein
VTVGVSVGGGVGVIVGDATGGGTVFSTGAWVTWLGSADGVGPAGEGRLQARTSAARAQKDTKVGSFTALSLENKATGVHSQQRIHLTPPGDELQLGKLAWLTGKCEVVFIKPLSNLHNFLKYEC